LKLFFLFTPAITLLLIGCTAPEKKAKVSQELIWHDQEIIQKKTKPIGHTKIFSAPDIDNHVIMVSGFEKIKKLSSTVSIKIERAWQDQHNYFFIVAVQNDTDKGTRANFYVFSHDALGRVINVQVDDFFFKSNETKYKRITISKNSKVKKWSMSVK
jgi:hypothetical protein